MTVKSGKLTIAAGGDGIKSSPDKVDDAGNPDDTVSLDDIILEGGEVNITAAADGIQGDNSVTVNGGSYQITTNGGYMTTLSEVADSCKGIKSDSNLTVMGGILKLTVQMMHCTAMSISVCWEKTAGADGYFLYRYDSSKKL